MEQKALDEFINCKVHVFLLAHILIVVIGKGDRIVGKSKNSMIGNSHPMGVTPQVFENMFRGTEDRFGEYNRVFRVKCVKKRRKRIRRVEIFAVGRKFEKSRPIKTIETFEENTLKDSREHLDMEKELLSEQTEMVCVGG